MLLKLFYILVILKGEEGMEKQILQWHPAFQAACQVELREDEEFLQFFDEHTLTKKPLQMDILIIKVKPGHAVRKSIGKIFRKHNIVEYKSPDDYICINDFYKVMGYACIYQSDTKKVMDIRPEDMTVTLVCCHYPREMMNHIEKRFGVEPEEVYKGIYHVKGLLFPLQMVITKRLPKEEYTWLSRLQRNLDVISDIEPLAIAYKDVAHDPSTALRN